MSMLLIKSSISGADGWMAMNNHLQDLRSGALRLALMSTLNVHITFLDISLNAGKSVDSKVSK